MLLRGFSLVLIILSIITDTTSYGDSVLRKPLNGTFSSKRLTSGPIFLLDSRTILVTQFTYSNIYWKNVLERHNKWFKAKLVNSTLIDLELSDEKDAHINKRKYYGENIILKVPDSPQFNIFSFDELVIVNDDNKIKTSVKITDTDKHDLPDHATDTMMALYHNGKPRFFYPKCSPFDSYSVNSDTIATGTFREMQRIPIHEVKNESYNTDPFEPFYEPFYSPLQCTRFIMDEEDNITVLMNLRLITPNYPDLKLACLDGSTEDGEDIVKERVYVCLDEDKGGARTYSSSSFSLLSVLSVICIWQSVSHIFIN